MSVKRKLRWGFNHYSLELDGGNVEQIPNLFYFYGGQDFLLKS